MNTDELPFVYENDVKVLPTFPVVVAQPGFWARDLDTGIDWVKVVHGEHDLVHAQAAAALRHLSSKTRVLEVIDKGPGKGALIYSQRKVHDKASGELLATITQTSFCRGDGGFGGPPSRARAAPDARSRAGRRSAICRRARRWR